MSIMTPKRRPEADAAGGLNQATVAELSSAAGSAFTGSIDIVERSTKATARLFLYEGGLYAADLDGFAPQVSHRLIASGSCADLSAGDRDLLRGLDVPDAGAIAHAVESGWFSVEALGRVHQEFLVAAFGRVTSLPKVKVRMHKGQTTSHFCTLPLPIEPLFGLVRMREDRLQETWAMLAPGVGAADAVLCRTEVPVPVNPATPELAAMAREVDGHRGLDQLAQALGFTRAEAVHVASLLVSAGLVRVDPEVAVVPAATSYLVPEAFGTHRVVPRTPAIKPVAVVPERVADEAAAAPPSPPAHDEATAPRVRLPEPLPLPLRTMDDVPLRERRLEEARAEVTRLLGHLQDAVRAEQEAINRTAEVSQRLREARAAVARIEIDESLPLGIT
ncbi:MAG: hypothetical protein QG661_2496 [Actinomycetota bacterium]|jgi:hypothetical protein|nr:hypothetical protein [Chloroflexota bacterium]MDQ5975287.1 hypothetical protein [Actinomycetota bacterium]